MLYLMIASGATVFAATCLALARRPRPSLALALFAAIGTLSLGAARGHWPAVAAMPFVLVAYFVDRPPGRLPPDRPRTRP